MNANNGVAKASAAARTLREVTGGARMTMVLSPLEAAVEYYLDDEAMGTKPVKPIVDTYGRDSVICGKLRRGEAVPVMSPHLAAWLLGMQDAPRTQDVEDIVRLNHFIQGM